MSNLFDAKPLIEKYKIFQPPMVDNPTVQAILDAERLETGTYGPDNAPLFHPSRSPAMWERANDAMAELRTGMAEGCVHYTSDDYDDFEIENPPDDAVFIWWVGSRTVLVCCRAGASATDRRLRGPDYFSGMLRFFSEVDDYSYKSAVDPDLRCNLGIAEACGGKTRLMPHRRPPFILLWRACLDCEGKARFTAETNFKISVMAAQSALPLGARIDPGSPVPPRP